MLIQRLDVAAPCPHTMAFCVARAPLDRYRAAVRAIVERADPRPVRKLAFEVLPAYEELLGRVRWRVPVTALAAAFEIVGVAPAWLDSVQHVDMWPNTWFAITSLVGRHHQGGTADRDAARARLVQMNLVALAQLLEGVREVPEQAPSAPPSGAIDWVRNLRFQAPGDRPSTQIADAFDDVVRVPKESDWRLGASAVEMLELVRARTAPSWVLELLVGPFVLSQGPGPFLPPPAASRAVEDPSWLALPLFRGPQRSPHASWPFCAVRSLEGPALGQALARTAGAHPSRDWWPPAERHAFDDRWPPGRAQELWDSWIDRDWPRCRDRFVALLSTALRDDQAVVLLDGEFAHEFGPDVIGERVVID